MRKGLALSLIVLLFCGCVDPARYFIHLNNQTGAVPRNRKNISYQDFDLLVKADIDELDLSVCLVIKPKVDLMIYPSPLSIRFEKDSTVYNLYNKWISDFEKMAVYAAWDSVVLCFSSDSDFRPIIRNNYSRKAFIKILPIQNLKTGKFSDTEAIPVVFVRYLRHGW